MHTELMSIISNASKYVLESGQSVTTISITTDGSRQIDHQSKRLLSELFEIIFEQFRKISTGHSVVIKYFGSTAEKYRMDIKLYEITDVWNKIQAVVGIKII